MTEFIRKIFDVTFWKFILVGIVNTIVGAGVMFFVYNVLHMGYWISSAANYIVGSIVSYFLNKNFTFRKKGSSWGMIAKFVINILICYLLAYSVAKPAVMCVLSGQSKIIQENVAMFAGMCFFVLFNYVGQRWIVFRSQKREED